MAVMTVEAPEAVAALAHPVRATRPPPKAARVGAGRHMAFEPA